MAYCYTEIETPAFFAMTGNCENVKHDLKIVSGTLDGADNQLVSAVLIQLHTDKNNQGERGWWGEQFMNFQIGTQVWTLTGMPNTNDLLNRSDKMLRQAFEPLIDQRLIDDVEIRTIHIMGGVEITVDVIRNKQSLFRIVTNG